MNRARRAVTSGVIGVAMLAALSPSLALADQRAPVHVTQVQVERSVAPEAASASAPLADLCINLLGIVINVIGTCLPPNQPYTGGSSTPELPAGALLGIVLVPGFALYLRKRRRRRH